MECFARMHLVVLSFLYFLPWADPSLAVPRVHFFVYATDITPNLCVLAQTIDHFSDHTSKLFIVGLSGRAQERCLANMSSWDPLKREGRMSKSIIRMQKMRCKSHTMEALLQDAVRIKKLGIDGEDLFVFTDAFDILLQRRVVHLVKAFHALRYHTKKKVFFGGDSECWPFDFGYLITSNPNPSKPEWTSESACRSLKNQSSQQHGLYPYLNSGSYMGHVEDIIRIFELAKKRRGEANDQALWNLVMLDHPSMIGIDYNASLFFSVCRGRNPTFGRGSDGEIKLLPVKANATAGGGIKAPEFCGDGYFDDPDELPVIALTRTQPVVLHFNGKATKKQYMKKCSYSFIRSVGWNPNITVIDVDDGGRPVRLGDRCSKPNISDTSDFPAGYYSPPRSKTKPSDGTRKGNVANCVGFWQKPRQCSKPCGGGRLEQTYTIQSPVRGNGKPCPAQQGAVRTLSCNTQPCGIGVITCEGISIVNCSAGYRRKNNPRNETCSSNKSCIQECCVPMKTLTVADTNVSSSRALALTQSTQFNFSSAYSSDEVLVAQLVASDPVGIQDFRRTFVLVDRLGKNVVRAVLTMYPIQFREGLSDALRLLNSFNQSVAAVTELIEIRRFDANNTLVLDGAMSFYVCSDVIETNWSLRMLAVGTLGLVDITAIGGTVNFVGPRGGLSNFPGCQKWFEVITTTTRFAFVGVRT